MGVAAVAAEVVEDEAGVLAEAFVIGVARCCNRGIFLLIHSSEQAHRGLFLSPVDLSPETGPDPTHVVTFDPSPIDPSHLPTLAPAGRAVLPAAARLLPLASRLASTGVLRRATTSAPRNISTTSGSSGRTTRAGAGALSTGAPPFGGGYRGGRRNFSSGSSSSSFGGSIPNIPDIPAPSASLVAAAVVGASAIYLAKRAVLMTDAGVTYVVQNNLTGQINLKKKKNTASRS